MCIVYVINIVVLWHMCIVYLINIVVLCNIHLVSDASAVSVSFSVSSSSSSSSEDSAASSLLFLVHHVTRCSCIMQNVIDHIYEFI